VSSSFCNLDNVDSEQRGNGPSLSRNPKQHSSGHTADTDPASVTIQGEDQNPPVMCTELTEAVVELVKEGRKTLEVIMLLCLLYSMQALYQLMPKKKLYSAMCDL